MVKTITKKSKRDDLPKNKNDRKERKTKQSFKKQKPKKVSKKNLNKQNRKENESSGIAPAQQKDEIKVNYDFVESDDKLINLLNQLKHISN